MSLQYEYSTEVGARGQESDTWAGIWLGQPPVVGQAINFSKHQFPSWKIEIMTVFPPHGVVVQIINRKKRFLKGLKRAGRYSKHLTCIKFI